MTQPHQPQQSQQPYGGTGQWAPPPPVPGVPHGWGAPHGAVTTGSYGPPAGQPPIAPPPAPKPRRTGLKILGGVVGGMIVLGAISNGAGDGGTAGDPSPVPAAAAGAPAAEVPAAEVPAAEVPAPAAFPGVQPDDTVGDAGATLALDGLSVTASALDEGDDTFGETLCTTVSYANGGGDTVSYGAYDWSMQNPAGAIVNLTFFGGADSFLSTGELVPGGTVSGQVCFEDANAGSGTYVLLYDPPSFLSTERLAWLNAR